MRTNARDELEAVNALDVESRRKVINIVRGALQAKFSSSGYPVGIRIRDWEQTLDIRGHVKSTRNIAEADCFTFSAALNYKRNVPLRDNTSLESLHTTPCFVKFAWKTQKQSYGAFAERQLLAKDIEPLLERALTPCLPFTIYEFKLPNDAGLAAWELYRCIVQKSEKHAQSRQSARTSKGRHVHLLAMEACGEMTLADYLLSAPPRNDILPIFLMLFHALGVLADAGISHNDLHLRNVVIKRTPLTTVSFKDRTFATTAVPVIIDWDMGCSTKRKNKSLIDYHHVGIFNTHNPLFDMFGIVKSLSWAIKRVSTYELPRCVLRSAATEQLMEKLTRLFAPAVNAHPWLFAFEFQDSDGENLTCVQQTPYVPMKRTGTVATWPKDVVRMAPTFDALQHEVFMMIEASEEVLSDTARFVYA